jgi:hypothetical protein
MSSSAAPTIFDTPYRTADARWTRERDALLAERATRLRQLPPVFAGVYGRRWGRVSAGFVMVFGAVALLLMGLASLLFTTILPQNWQAPYSLVLLATLGVSVLAYITARVLAHHALPGGVRRVFAASGDARVDVERLSYRTPAADAADLVENLERKSLAWPLVGLSLVTPLSIHMALACLFSMPLQSFDTWIAISLVLTVPAHVTLALFAAEFARDVSAAGAHDAPNRSAGRAALRAWGITVVVSLIPGVVLLGIPPLLVAATGVFIPIMFSVARNMALTERGRLALEGNAAQRPPSSGPTLL